MRKSKAVIKKTINKLFANSCIHCGRAVKENCDVLCESCMYELYRNAPKEPSGVFSVLSYEKPQTRALVLYMKDHCDKDAFAFSATLLAHRLLRSEIKNLDEYCITFAPRSPISKIKCGFDQSEEIALCLSKELFGDSSRCVNLIGRRFFSKTQKFLSASERRKSMHKNLFVRKGVDIPEKVIVIDDVTTTGATLEEISLLLKDAGVCECVLVALACKEG